MNNHFVLRRVEARERHFRGRPRRGSPGPDVRRGGGGGFRFRGEEIFIRRRIVEGIELQGSVIRNVWEMERLCGDPEPAGLRCITEDEKDREEERVAPSDGGRRGGDEARRALRRQRMRFHLAHQRVNRFVSRGLLAANRMCKIPRKINFKPQLYPLCSSVWMFYRSKIVYLYYKDVDPKKCM